MKKYIISLLLVLLLVIALVLLYGKNREDKDDKANPVLVVNSFNDCVKEGNPIMKSYPRQCRSLDGRLFVEDIGNILEKDNLIRINYPLPNDKISSPLEIFGEARGLWCFEADFPITLINSQGDIISEGIASAEDDWMTEDFVSFNSTLYFNISDIEEGEEGRLILKKDNPSGLEEHDDFLEIPVIFSF